MNIPSYLLVSLLAISALSIQISEARKNRIAAAYSSKCQLEECQLRPTHLALYSYVKRALNNNFDIGGKEILPTLKAIETLKRRFYDDNNSDLNGTEIMKNLLNNETLIKAVNVFNSEDGKSMIDFYKSSVNGGNQVLSCSQFRIEDIERVSGKLKSNEQLRWLFSRIHQNFLTKSAKKCLKHSCNYLDLSMSRLDSILSKYKPSEGAYNQLFGEEVKVHNETSVEDVNRREFEREELKLCQFFKKSNEINCTVSGRELAEVNLTNNTTLDELLKIYQLNMSNSSKISDTTTQLADTKKIILGQCKQIKGLLDYNLHAIKWYRKEGLIDEQKVNSRTFWCPSLHYWLQIDRLCTELDGSESNSKIDDKTTFSYEVQINKFKTKEE